MQEHHLEVTRTARYVTLGEGVAAPRAAWFVLHGYGQLGRRFMRSFERLDDGARLVIAPEALNRYYVGDPPGVHGPDSVVGATWMTREDRLNEVHDYVRYLDRLHEHVVSRFEAPPRLTVLGFSQGVHTACRWTVLGKARPATLILWGAAMPPDLELESAASAWRATRLRIVAGERDESFSPAMAARTRDRLRAAGIDAELVLHPGAHVVHRETLERLGA